MKVAMVLAAGLGTRLRPLTDHTPKPLCPVGDRPQIDHILARLAEGGVERAVVNTHHRHEQFSDAWAKRQPLEIVRVHEPEILGTGGGIANARAALGDGPVLVWNADILAAPRLPAVFAASNDLATIVVGARRPKGEGTVGLTVEGNVARLRGARFGQEIASADYAGIAILSRRVRERLIAPGCLVGDLLVPMVERGHQIATFAQDDGFTDTGSLGAYLDANLEWLDRENASAAYVDASAEISSTVTVQRSVVGRRARVEGDGLVRDSVIWPGALARAPLERAIVTPFGVVVA